jgi:hypothetical protein
MIRAQAQQFRFARGRTPGSEERDKSPDSRGSEIAFF